MKGGKKRKSFNTHGGLFFSKDDSLTCAPRHMNFLNVPTGTDVHGAAPSARNPVSPTFWSL